MKIKKGQSLIELLIAMALFALITGSAIVLIVDSQKSNIRTIDDSKAVAYAREGLEAARAIRDRNFLLLQTDLDGSGLSTTNGYFEFANPADTLENKYTRQIFIQDVYRDLNGNIVLSGGTLDPATKKIVSRVIWETHQIEFESYLTDWQGTDWIQTSEADFNAGTHNQTETQPTGDGELKLAISASDSGFFSESDLGKHGQNVFVVGNTAYITIDSSNKGLYSVDVSDVENPLILDWVDIENKGLGIEVAGNYAYATAEDDDDGFSIINISNPSNMSVISNLDIPDKANDLEIRGNYAYLVLEDGNRGFAVANISNPNSPSLVATRDIGEKGNDIIVSGNYAFISNQSDSHGLTVIDISNPTSPTVVKQFDFGPHSHGLDINGNYLYIAGHGSADLAIIDITAPTNPILIGGLNFSDDKINDLAYKSGIVYLAVDNTNDGIAAVDVSDPANPTLLYELDVSGKGTGAFATDTHVFITTSTSNRGLVIIETTQQGFPSSGDFTSQIFDSGSATTSWRTLSFSSTVSPGGSISFQIRTADTSPNISNASWVGPDGTSATFYTSSPNTIITDPNTTGTRYLQYKVFFTADGNSSPILDRVTLNFVP